MVSFFVIIPESSCFIFFFFNDTATTEIYTLSLHDALPIYVGVVLDLMIHDLDVVLAIVKSPVTNVDAVGIPVLSKSEDRKSTRLNSSHTVISYAVFCLKKKKQHPRHNYQQYSVFVE